MLTEGEERNCREALLGGPPTLLPWSGSARSGKNALLDPRHDRAVAGLSQELEIAPGRWVLDALAPEDVPALATDALARGCNAESVAVLAGLERRRRRTSTMNFLRYSGNSASACPRRALR